MQQNEDMQMRNSTLELCMKKDKVCHNQMKKLLNGTENQQSKEVQLRDMKKLLNGTQKRQNKDMQMRSSTWELCLKKDKVYRNQMKKLLNGTQKQLNKDMQMHDVMWD
uniref:Uncharacterized protein n=1 Tax=Plectus sambesii TaxID=2011161 RepID=A0A914V0H5_9BILA